jgi:hypothetical protein
MWPKLANPMCSTVRPHSHWKAGQTVQVYYRNRGPNRKALGIADIVSVETVVLNAIFIEHGRLLTDAEARDDGFADLKGMAAWMYRTYHDKFSPVMDKLTLRWRIQCLPQYLPAILLPQRWLP